MKRIVLLFLLVTPFLGVQAQKADIDNFRIPVKYSGMPKNYIEPELRTFDISGPNSDDIKIYGWTRTDQAPSLLAKISHSRFVVGAGSIDKKVNQKKDKNGKVLSTKTTYAVKSENRGNGRLTVFGPKNEILTARQKAKAAKKKAKEAAKKKKKKKEVAADNPFLDGVDATQTDAMDEDANREKAYFTFISNKYPYATGYKTTSKAAWNEFNGNKDNEANSSEEDFSDYSRRTTSAYLNNRYGYAPQKSNVRFLILDSKKHPEYKMYQQAMGALKVILGKTAYNKSNEQVLADAAPIVDYLTKLTDKYKEDKKHPKRIRKSAYYNLAQFYLYMDNLEKCKEMGQALIDTELDKKSGKSFIEQADEVAELLAFHKMDSRHLLTGEDAEAEGVTENEDEDDEGGK